MQTKVFIVIALLSFCCVKASSFTCGDVDTAMCMKTFGREFESKFRDLYTEKMIGFFNLCLDIVKETEAEIKDGDNEAKNVVATSEKSFSDTLKKLKEKADGDKDDFAEIVKAVNSGFEKLTWGSQLEERYRPVLERINVRERLVTFLKDLAFRIASLWNDMYTGLRPQDLKDYPVYDQVNDLMEKLQDVNGENFSSRYFIQASEILAEEFDLNVFKQKPEIS